MYESSLRTQTHTMFIRYLYTFTCICWFQYRVCTYNLCQLKNARKDSYCGHMRYWYEVTNTSEQHTAASIQWVQVKVEAAILKHWCPSTRLHVVIISRLQYGGKKLINSSIMQQPLTVANPDMDVRSSGRVQSVALYCSVRTDLWIRICHCPL